MEIMGHRGAAGIAPENTMPGFGKCRELGIRWVELDIRPTRDGELVLLHDKSLKRTANKDRDVNDLSFEEIQKLDVGSHFNTKFAGTRVPALAEVLGTFHGNLNFNIELKDDEDQVDGQITRLFELLDKYQLRHKVLLSSFKEKILEALREADDRLQLAIISNRSADYLKKVATRLDCAYINAGSKILSEGLVKWAHDKNKKISAWTANESALMHVFAELHVDLLVTDYPDVALETLEEYL